MMVKFSKSNIIFFIVLLGLLLRIYDLGRESLWVDEVASYGFSKLAVSQFFKADYTDYTLPPLYYIILHMWTNIFGNSEFLMRLPSAFFGIVSIYLIYKVAGQIFDDEVGLLSSLFLALSVFHINYSQEARMYSLMTVLVLLSYYFFLKLVAEYNINNSVGYITATTLLIYTHYYGFFTILAQNIYVGILLLKSKDKSKIDVRKWISLQFLLILLYLPWITALIEGVNKIQGGFWIPEPNLLELVKTFYIFSGSSLLILLFSISSLFAIFKIQRLNLNVSKDSKQYLLLTWLLSPIIIPLIISKFTQPFYHFKYTIAASLAFYILVAAGVKNLRSRNIKLIVISLIVLFSLMNVAGYYSEINKERWRNAANLIDSNAQAGDLLLFNAGNTRGSYDYYSKRDDLVKKRFPEKTRDVDDINIKNLASIIEDHERVWVIYSHSGDHQGLITSTLNESYNLLSHKSFVSNRGYNSGKEYVGVEIYLFEKK